MFNFLFELAGDFNPFGKQVFVETFELVDLGEFLDFREEFSVFGQVLLKKLVILEFGKVFFEPEGLLSVEFKFDEDFIALILGDRRGLNRSFFFGLGDSKMTIFFGLGDSIIKSPAG